MMKPISPDFLLSLHLQSTLMGTVGCVGTGSGKNRPQTATVRASQPLHQPSRSFSNGAVVVRYSCSAQPAGYTQRCADNSGFAPADPSVSPVDSPLVLGAKVAAESPIIFRETKRMRRGVVGASAFLRNSSRAKVSP